MCYQQTIWMHPDRVYVCSGGASANSMFFEDRYCHKLFFKYLNRFVIPMANILHYKLNATEWAILIHTKSEEEIKAAYFRQRNKSDTANREQDHTAACRMISEHFRMALSNFAKESNAYLGRKGVVVMKRFDKYPITSEKSYKQEFERICDLKFCSYQQIKEKYRADEELYDKNELLLDIDSIPHVLRSGIRMYKLSEKFEKGPILLKLIRPNSHVLRKILTKGKNNINPQNTNPKLE